MDKGIAFRVRWHDADVAQVQVSASNGEFGGAVDVYDGIDALQELANSLKHFPKSTLDTREVTLGAFGPGYAGGAVRLRLYCKNGAGHAEVEVQMESDHQEGRVESAYFVVPIEAAAIDAFVDELYRLNAEKRGTASLRGK